MRFRSFILIAVFMCLVGGQASAQQAGYQLGSGDRVRVTVFGEDDLSGEFELDSEGTFSMPLVGTVDALKQTPRQLEDGITKLLLNGYLKNPRVNIEVLNYRPFYILGEVNSPGGYPYRAGMTILNAAALAGGFTYRADEDDIEVTRANGAEPEVLPPETIVRPGDIIRVNERLF